MGQLEHGQYEDEFTDVHPDLLERYYGTRGRPLRRRHLGAGSTGDDYIEDDLSAAQEGNIRNAPIEPPLNHCPFDEQGMRVFHEMLGDALIQRTIPEGFGLREDEWDDSGYPPSEEIRMRGGKHANIVLPFHLWWPRAVRWARALKLLTVLQVMQE